MKPSPFNLNTFPFHSFDELCGKTTHQGVAAWPAVQRAIGYWRHDIAHLLRGCTIEAIEPGKGLRLEFGGTSPEALKIGISPEASQAAIEKVMHSFLTTLSLAGSPIDEVVARSQQQIQMVKDYVRIHPRHSAYLIYSQQVVTLIEVSRNAVIHALFGPSYPWNEGGTH